MGIRFYNLNGFFVKKLAHGVTLLVENGEIVYNTDDNKFYTGNGTLGGKPLAGDSTYTGNAITIDFGDRIGLDAATRIEYGDRI